MALEKKLLSLKVESAGIAFAVFFFTFFVLCPINLSAKAKSEKRRPKSTPVAVKEKEDLHAEAPAKPSQVPEKTVEAPAADAKKPGEPAEAQKAEGKDSYTLYERYEKPIEEAGESTGWLIFKTLFVLGNLVGGFYYFFRFVTKKVGIQVLGRDVVRVLSVVPIGQNKSLQVVDLAGRLMVLGVSDNNISLISEIKDKDEIDRIRILSSRSEPVEPGGFQQYIVKQMGKFLGKNKGSGAVSDGTGGADESEMDRLEYLRRQRERLKKMNGDYEK